MNCQTLPQIIMLEDDKTFCKVIKEVLSLDKEFLIKSDYQTCNSFESDFNFKNWENISIFWIDLNLPDGSGISMISKIKIKYPQSKCLVCTFQSDDENLFKALKNGADGYLLKDTSIDALKQSLHDILNDGAVMSPSIAKKIIQSFHPSQSNNLIELSKRENEVIALLAKGLLYKEISDHLHIGLETTKKHISNIYQKLHVQNRTEAVLKYLR